MATKTIYPSIPAPGNDTASLRATVDAMRQTLTMVIMNAQNPNPNFTPSSASQVFVTQDQLKASGVVGPTGPTGPQGPPGPGIAEAPNDVNTYGRHALAWKSVFPIDCSINLVPTNNVINMQAPATGYVGIRAVDASGNPGWGVVLGLTGSNSVQQAGITNPAGQLVLWVDSNNVVHVLNPIVVGP